jgi:hypothetical protein
MSGDLDPGQLQFAALHKFAGDSAAPGTGENEVRFDSEFQIAFGTVSAGRHGLDGEFGSICGRSFHGGIEGEPKGVRLDAREGTDPKHDPVHVGRVVCARLGKDRFDRGFHNSNFMHGYEG